MKIKILFFFSLLYCSVFVHAEWTTTLTVEEIFSQAKSGSAYHEGLAGIYLRAGEGGQLIDLNASRIWSQKAAEQNHPFGFYNLANLEMLEGDLEQATQYYSDAAPLLQQLVSDGDAVAVFCMGEIDFKVTPTNIPRALEWFMKSSDLGYPQAQATLGALYLNGLPGILSIDKTKGIELLNKAAEEDSLTAKFNLGMAYLNGDRVTASGVEALRFLKLAEQQNFAEAQYTLGVLLIEGSADNSKNTAEGVHFLQKAKAQNHTVASEYLDKINVSFGVGWTWNLGPWSYSADDEGWLYYHFSGEKWMVWRQKNNSWYEWDIEIQFWKLV